MKRRIIVLSTILVLGITFLVQGLTVEGKQADLFNEVLLRTNSKTLEYGITAIFRTHKDRRLVCDDLLKKLDLYDDYNISVSESDKVYCVEFGKNNINGYIETMQYENYNIVTINFTKEDKNNDLNNLMDKLKNSIDDKVVNVRYFQYLKAKLPNDNINLANNEVLNILKVYRATNINSINLENGYSTTAYTKMYDFMQSNGNLIDFNYAICKYDSGSYLIIGTPEINVTY